MRRLPVLRAVRLFRYTFRHVNSRRPASHLWVQYNQRVTKRHCTSRAEWRLQTGKPAATISTHYRLDCDYGTAVIVCWQQGGNEPIYVCESHAKQLGCSRDHGPDVRIITRLSDQAMVPTSPASSRGASGVAEPKVGTEVTGPYVPMVIVPSPPSAPTRSAFRDLTFGDSAKAMVDEAIWNMEGGDYEVYRSAIEEGKTPAEAARAAGGQLEVIHRKIADYTLKLQAALSEPKATISVVGTIDKPLEQIMLEIIGNDAMSDLEKDSFVQELGTLQEWVKRGLHGDVTPLQANRIAQSIGDRLNWGGATDISEDFRPVYRDLYVSLKTAIRIAVPEAQNYHDRLTNLYAAKSEMDRTVFAPRCASLARGA